MSEPQFTPYDHEQMFVEVKVAYRLSELGGLLEPDSYDNSELEEIDAEYDQWLMKIKADAWHEGLEAERDYISAFNNWHEHITDHRPEPPTNPYQDNT